MMVAAAGLYLELFLASIAMVIWAHTQQGALHTFAHNAAIIGTVITLFFNANPLMRFDGYYLLSELLEVPNLATRGRTWLQRALIWLLASVNRGSRSGRARARAGSPDLRRGRCCWQMLVLAGLLLAVVAGVNWVALPVLRFGKSVAESLHAGAGRWPSFLIRGTVACALIAAVIFFPWHRSITAEGVIELADTEVLRAECPGFVFREYVQDGEIVAAGQLLVELRNDEAAAELAQHRAALARQELAARLAYTRDDVAVLQAEEASVRALRKDVLERETFLTTLQIRAPFAGRVTNRQLGRRRGVFLTEGEEILRLGRVEDRELKLAVSESDAGDERAANPKIPAADALYPGERAHVRLTSQVETSLWSDLNVALSRWLRRKTGGLWTRDPTVKACTCCRWLNDAHFQSFESGCGGGI